MDKLRIVKIAANLVGALLVVAFLHYHLPRTAVVTVEGTDVKLMDASGQVTTKRNAANTRDVRFINTITRNNKVLVLRNEDTGWGWPPYFKFDSSDLVAKAQGFANTQPPQAVLITFYGWRSRLFTLYPNIVRMRPVAADYSHFPWFNIIFLMLLGGGLLFVRLKTKRLYRRIRDRFSPSKKPEADANSDKAAKGE
jgi:hypothetical protein